MRRERCEKAASTGKNLPGMQTSFCLAQEVGAELAVGEIL
jgi:hypothetical protein